MKKQKGQALIEFALVFPFFLLLVFGVIYSGMLFYDYSTLSNVARSAARERAITQPASGETQEDLDGKITGYYFKDGKFVNNLVTSLYRPASSNPFVLEMSNDDVVVTINMELNNSGLVFADVILPQHYSIIYHMRKDYTEDSN